MDPTVFASSHPSDRGNIGYGDTLSSIKTANGILRLFSRVDSINLSGSNPQLYGKFPVRNFHGYALQASGGLPFFPGLIWHAAIGHQPPYILSGALTSNSPPYHLSFF